MVRFTSVVVGLLALLVWTPCQAQEFPRTTLGRAATCYYALDYQCVVDALDELDDRYPPAGAGLLPRGVRPLDLPLLLEAGRILAVAHLALGDRAKARAIFRWLLEIDADFLVAGTEVPPRFLGVFYEVRASALAPPRAWATVGVAAALSVARGRLLAGRATGGRVADLEPENKDPEPLPPEPLLLSLCAVPVWVVPTGTDAETYGGATGLGLGGHLIFDEAWVIGVNALFSKHPVILENLVVPSQPDLHVFMAAASGAYQFRWAEWVRFQPGISVGYATYGLEEWMQRNGVVLGVQLDIQLPIYSPIVVAGQVGSRTVLPFQSGRRSSTLLTAGLGVGATF
jgi:hypothetical protein